MSAVEVCVVAFLIVLCAAPVASQRCRLSREDTVPCQYRNMALVRAGPNQFASHDTRIRQEGGVDICNVRPRDQILEQIPNFGTNEMRILYSPGFNDMLPYESEERTEYVVQCGEGELVYFNVTFLDLQSEDCPVSEGNNRCQDYLEIIREPFGSVEECGVTPSSDSLRELENGRLTVVFRTSEDTVVGRGFEMYIVCYRQLSEDEMEGCVDASLFADGVCQGEGRRKRSCPGSFQLPPVPTFYAEIFPNSGYQRNVRMLPDLALFNNRWSKLRGRPGFRLRQVNILYPQTVRYNQRTITVMDRDGNIVSTFPDINVLDTFDTNGEIERHFVQATTDFNGAAILTMVNRYGSLQLFRYDPRAAVPNDIEERELLLMSTPILDSIFVNNSGVPLFRRNTENSAFAQSDRAAVLAALRSEEACNPVLRAQSRATLTYYSQIDEEYVNCLKTFDISCSRNETMLNCRIPNDIIVPELTMCQIDNQEPMQCEAQFVTYHIFCHMRLVLETYETTPL